MELYDIIKKFIGPIKPVGETDEDNNRLNNLQETISLTDNLIRDLISVAGYKKYHQFSIKEAGIKAGDYLNTLKAELNEN